MNRILPLAFSLCLTLTAQPALADEPALSTYTETSSSVSMKATWPRFGLVRADRESETIVKDITDRFRTAAEQERKLRDNDPTMPRLSCELVLEGTVSGNGKVSGMLWNVYEYTGGAHGNIQVFSRNYACSDGRTVGLNDLFGNPKKALALMSELSRKKLLDQELPQDMVKAGTTPEADNFSTFLVEKDGLTLYFNPYQVGPWAAGVVTVKLSLKELAAAQPNMIWWK